jgi:diacylglycerol kinase
MNQLNNWLNSFKHAFNGLILAISERHIRVHIAASILITCIGYLLDTSTIEWLFICSAIALVFVSELINTCIESLCDIITLEYSPFIKKIKDIAAASVLISAIYAIAVAIFTVLPKLYLYI